MNKVGLIDIQKAYLGNKELSSQNAFINGIPLISASIPYDEIWYTSSNGIVAPYRTSSLPTIVSNTYVGGKGIIKFATDVISIGHFAFNQCTSLTSVTIPNSVTSIGSGAFQSCTGLTSVSIPDSVTSIGEGAFYGCTGLPVENNLRYADTYLVGAVDKTLSSYTIKNGTKWIGDFAFQNCNSLASIEIPNSVTSIGSRAFHRCFSLTTVTIPNNITIIKERAFESCTGLMSINVASDNLNYCSVDGVLFNKNKTTIIQYPGGKQGTYTIPNSVISIEEVAFQDCTGLTSVTIPNSVTSIGNGAFYGCDGLTSVSIPNSVTSIGESAFQYCDGLTSVNYTGTIAQWNAISKGQNWHYNVPATVVHCSDGDVAI